MSPEALFTFASRLTMAGWALLIFVPRWRESGRLVGGLLVPVLLAALYLWLIATRFAGAEGGFGSLAEVGRLFENPHLLLAGWVHYLAFDLFIGAWEVRDARRLGISHLLVVPCLLLTFLFGPIGLLAYLLLRGLGKRAWMLEA